MSKRKRWAGGALAALMLVTSGLLATSVQADETDDLSITDQTANSIVMESGSEIVPLAFPGCQLGWACVWTGKDYTGVAAAAAQNGGYTWAENPGGALAYSFQNSAAANGNLCHKTRFFNSGKTRHFVLNSQTRLGGTSRDPNLSNGAGNAGSTNISWTNKIRSFEFFSGANCV
ncbi:MAG: hypothetical protein ACTHW1_09770 [Ancrocorticia sp.]|uniref:hypothetical protein n=1 Tax=Ancrocorticia sp. TaxID=2593684 RepID=UPI003F93C4DB